MLRRADKLIKKVKNRQEDLINAKDIVASKRFGAPKVEFVLPEI